MRENFHPMEDLLEIVADIVGQLIGKDGGNQHLAVALILWGMGATGIAIGVFVFRDTIGFEVFGVISCIIGFGFWPAPKIIARLSHKKHY
ncbi:MAG: hypothetical protein GXP06_04195 [Alphaproteobacteria bacterium]|nr:hypothetical protein [Alphaproteobacteria bacterium]